MIIKCLVTGGAGFIGSHLADKLIENGYRDEKGGIIGKSGVLLSGFRPITHHATFL